MPLCNPADLKGRLRLNERLLDLLIEEVFLTHHAFAEERFEVG